MQERIVAWLTSHALTQGIQRVTGVTSSEWPSMLVYGEQHAQYARGKDWHRTPEAALARAEEMRKTKSASLRRSLAKTEAMTFYASQEEPGEI